MHSVPSIRSIPQHRFAIVLGSGGVRSIAALGMVEVLVREGLRPDLVVGCSAGAMFGALIAAEAALPDIHALFHRAVLFTPAAAAAA